MSEREPVRVPADVLEGLEAVRRHLGHNVLDVATIRHFANERTTHPRTEPPRNVVSVVAEKGATWVEWNRKAVIATCFRDIYPLHVPERREGGAALLTV